MTGNEDENVVRPWVLPEMGAPGVNARLIDAMRRREEEKKPALPTAEELQALRDAARQDGYEEGLRQGLSEGRARMDKALEAEKQRWATSLKPVLDALAAPLDAMDDAAEQALLKLCLSLSRQVVRRELHSDPGQVLAVIREAVQLLPESQQRIRVALHPEDARLVRELFLHNSDGDSRWQIVDEPTLARGGCKINTEDSRIDASLESRIAAVFAQVMGDEREAERGA